MGHNRLGSLPKTRRWKEVISLLEERADVTEIADASLVAVKAGLQRVPEDEGFQQTLTNIFRFIESARSPDFEAALKKSEFEIRPSPSLFDAIGSLKAKFDHDLFREGTKSDVSEIAQNSFTEVLFRNVSSETTNLFGSSIEPLRSSLQKHLTGDRFKQLMHEFFSVFTRRYVLYYLSRELSNHVGPGKRFENFDDHQRFNEALDLHVRQTVRIADEFTPGWFGRAEYERNLTRESVTRFAYVAFKKIVQEFDREAEKGG